MPGSPGRLNHHSSICFPSVHIKAAGRGEGGMPSSGTAVTRLRMLWTDWIITSRPHAWDPSAGLKGVAPVHYMPSQSRQMPACTLVALVLGSRWTVDCFIMCGNFVFVMDVSFFLCLFHASFVVLMRSGNCNTSCLELRCATVVIHHVVISQLR